MRSYAHARSWFLFAFVLFLAQFRATSSIAGQVQIDIDATGDTYIIDGNDNFGAESVLETVSNNSYNSLIIFDQATIESYLQAGDTLVSATVEVEVTSAPGGGGGNKDVGLQRMLLPWTEGNGTQSSSGTGSGATGYCATDSDISNTSTDCSGADLWEWQAVQAPDVTYASTPTDTVTVNSTGTISFDVTADIEDFLDDTLTNYGWRLGFPEKSGNVSRTFSSSEGSYPPQLVLIVNRNGAPTISGTPATSVNQDASYSFTPSASDPEMDTITFSIEGKPSWATFNTSTGQLSGTPDNADTHPDLNPYGPITITVSDAYGSNDLDEFYITVNNINDAPTISGTPPEAVREGQAYSFTPAVSDPDLIHPSETLSFSAQNLPSWMSLNTSTGEISGTPGSTDVGNYTQIALTVTDAAMASDTLDAGGDNQFEIEAVGMSIALTVTSPSGTLDFTPSPENPVPLGSSDTTETVTVTNDMASPVTLTFDAFDAATLGDYVIDPDDLALLKAGVSLAASGSAGDDFSFDVVFTPSGPGNDRTDVINLQVTYGLITDDIDVNLSGDALDNIIYVDPGTADITTPMPLPADDGSSWFDAYQNLQDGIDAAATAASSSPNGIYWVWVAENNNTSTRGGAYLPQQSVLYRPVLTLKADIHVFGGFTGSSHSESDSPGSDETSINERMGRTILDGDYDDTDPDASLQYDSLHVVDTRPNFAPDSRLDGFKIINGRAGLGGTDMKSYGGGMIAYRSDGLVVSNCWFEGNGAGIYGGGLLAAGSDMTVRDSVFYDNAAGSGGAIAQLTYSGYTGDVIVANVDFQANDADNGGAIDVSGGNVMTIINSTFSGNYASGTTSLLGKGGAIYANGTGTAVVTNATFYGNIAEDEGGAVKGDLNATVYIDNSAFWANDAYANNGGIGGDNAFFYNGALSYSCSSDSASGTNAQVTANPFAQDDGNMDGINEYFLTGSNACFDLGDNTTADDSSSGFPLIGEDWRYQFIKEPTNCPVSGSGDITLDGDDDGDLSVEVDAGRHYKPGVCGGGD